VVQDNENKNVPVTVAHRPRVTGTEPNKRPAKRRVNAQMATLTRDQI